MSKNYVAMLKKAVDYSRGELQPTASRRLKIFNQDSGTEKLYGNVEAIRSNDCANFIRAMMPELMEVFLDSTSIVLRDTPQGTENFKEIQSKVNDYNERMIFNTSSYPIAQFKSLKCSTMSETGVFKFLWEQEIETKKEMIGIITDPEQLQMFIQEFGSEAIVTEEVDGQVQAFHQQEIVTKSYPDFIYVDPSDFMYIPDADSIKDCSFIAHRVIKSKAYIENHYNLEEKDVNWSASLWKMGGNGEWDSKKNSQKSGYTAEESKSKKDKLHEVYECHVLVANENNKIENRIVTIIGNAVVEDVLNETGVRPFCIYQPDFSVMGIEFETIVDWIAPYQIQKTNFMRQAFKNFAKYNNSKVLIKGSAVANGGVKPSDFEKDDGYAIVNDFGSVDRETFKPIPSPQDPLVGVQQIDSAIQEITGITKYTQGTDAGNLNKTATGITAIMNQSQKRIKLIIRMLVESGFVSFNKWLTAKYLELGIIPEGTYFDSETGLGYRDNLMDTQKMMSVYPLFESLVATNFSNKYQVEFVKHMFNKNGLPTKSFFPTEEEMAQMQQQQAMMEQQQVMTGGMPEGMEGEPEMETITPEQADDLIDKYGVEAVEQMVAEMQKDQPR